MTTAGERLKSENWNKNGLKKGVTNMDSWQQPLNSCSRCQLVFFHVVVFFCFPRSLIPFFPLYIPAFSIFFDASFWIVAMDLFTQKIMKKKFHSSNNTKKKTIFPFILPTKFLFPAICNLGNINSGISSRFCNSWNCNTVDFAFPDSAPPKPAFSYLSSSRRTWHTHKD